MHYANNIARTHGKDQTILERIRNSVSLESSLDKKSFVGSRKHGVTSSCNNEITCGIRIQPGKLVSVNKFDK